LSSLGARKPLDLNHDAYDRLTTWRGSSEDTVGEFPK
jgi:hypothetical protein